MQPGAKKGEPLLETNGRRDGLRTKNETTRDYPVCEEGKEEGDLLGKEIRALSRHKNVTRAPEKMKRAN